MYKSPLSVLLVVVTLAALTCEAVGNTETETSELTQENNTESERNEAEESELEPEPIPLAGANAAASHGGHEGGGHGGHEQQEGHGGHEDGGHAKKSAHGGGHHGIRLASWRWDQYNSMFWVVLTIILAILINVNYHHIPVISYFPESCFIILLGIGLGAIITHESVELDSFPKLTPSLFFNVLLPPIILDAAFAIYNRDFLNNIFSIILFAVIGTVINTFAIGYSLYGLAYSGALGEFIDFKTNTTVALEPVQVGSVIKVTFNKNQTLPPQALLFSSLISAVDPVAVLAIFEEIKVNAGLYFLVFGESLFNDGVSVVIYNTMNALVDPSQDVGAKEVILGFVSFFFVVFGGLAIGVIFGALVSFLTTKTSGASTAEPLLVFATGYMAFIMAELFHWSGIISIIGFGLTVKRYCLTNCSSESYITIKHATHAMASASDSIIFLFLGMTCFTESHHLHPGFIIATIILCFLTRFLVTFGLSWILTHQRAYKISYAEQFIISYGGLRGAVGFSLAAVLPGDAWYRYCQLQLFLISVFLLLLLLVLPLLLLAVIIMSRDLFLTTALAMVLFTVFVQGCSIKLMVGILWCRCVCICGGDVFVFVVGMYLYLWWKFIHICARSNC